MAIDGLIFRHFQHVQAFSCRFGNDDRMSAGVGYGNWQLANGNWQLAIVCHIVRRPVPEDRDGMIYSVRRWALGTKSPGQRYLQP